MKTHSSPARLAGFPLTGDGALGALGGCLALGALSFGVYMNVHGPSPDLGTSKDFSVFAQLAPRGLRQARPPRTDDAGELDTTATATIPGRPTSTEAAAGDDAIAASMFVETADRDSAKIDIEGSVRTVHVGDDLPGAGEITAIVPGPRPMLKTSRGFVISARDR